MQQKEQEGMAGEGDHIYVIDVETRSFSKMLTILQMICFGMNCRKASWSLLLNLAQMFNKKKDCRLRYINHFHLATYLHYRGEKVRKNTFVSRRNSRV